MLELIVTVGLPYSWSDSEFNEHDNEPNYVKITPSQYDSYEDVTDVIKACFDNNKSVIYENYNLKMDTRMKFLHLFKDYEIKKICVLFVRAFNECLDYTANENERNDLYNMYTHMDLPWYYEGWDDIQIKRTGEFKSDTILNLFNNPETGLNNYLVDNKSLGKDLLRHYGLASVFESPLWVQRAALFQKIGIPFVHENFSQQTPRMEHTVSAYMSMFYTLINYRNHGFLRVINQEYDKVDLYTAVIIQWMGTIEDLDIDERNRLFEFLCTTNCKYLYKDIKLLTSIMSN